MSAKSKPATRAKRNSPAVTFNHRTPPTSPMSERIAFSPQDTARMLGVGLTTIWKMLASGQLVSLSVGRRRLIPADSIHALMARAR